MRRKEYQYQRDLTVNVGKCLWADPDKFGRNNFGKDGGRGDQQVIFAVFFSVNISKLIPKLPTKREGEGLNQPLIFALILTESSPTSGVALQR